MSRINRDIYTSLDVNGPYIRIDTQPVATTLDHNGNAVFTIAASTYYLTGDEAEIGDIDTLESDAVAPTDVSLDNQTPGVPHTAKNDGFISYQWYEIDANSTPIGAVTKLTDSAVYTGTTTNTLTVRNVQSPGTHLNQYYCILDYIPNLTSGQYDTGNAVNDTVTSDTVTLNVRPYLIITEQPVSTTTRFNPESGTVRTTAILSDTRSPWENYKLQFQWWEKNTINVGDLPNIRLIDGDYPITLSTSKTVESVSNLIQTSTITESVSDGVVKRVGIPTETTEVNFTISGAAGGSGGNVRLSAVGGSGGAGRVGDFKFTSNEIQRIRNAGAPTEYILSSGSKGNDGQQGSEITLADGGLGGLSYDLSADTIENDSIFGGKGGSSGPGGVAGSGGGGGAGAAILRGNNEWMAVAGGGGGGGGASRGTSGGNGSNALNWKEFDATDIDSNPPPSEIKPATVVNYNPKAGARGGNQDAIQYGFYVKSTSPISTVNTTTRYRIVVIWNNEIVVDTTTTLGQNDDVLDIGDSLLDGSFYVSNGNVKYYLSTHKGSELGWCDDESNLESVCIRGDGGYVNSFDVIRYSDSWGGENINVFDGADGAPKNIGDGGGGGGAGGGAISPSSGGAAGANPVADDEVEVIFRTRGLNARGEYIKFVKVPWYGFPETEPDRGQTIELKGDRAEIITVTLEAGATYDVVSSFEEGRTSDSLRILQDFTPFANGDENIVGRSIGMDASGVGDNIQEGGNENNFRDHVVSVSDGTFAIIPQTVRLEDGEIVGKSIIRYTAPTASRNLTVASGGQGGQSLYDTTKLTKLTTSDNTNNDTGAINMVITTEQPFNEINTNIVNSVVNRNLSIRGAHPYPPSVANYQNSGFTSNLTISANYVFSKKLVCQIIVKDTGTNPVTNARTSFNNTLYTNTVDFIVTDERDTTIIVEQIRHNDDFAILSSLNLNNGDVTFEKSNSVDIKETEYYSFYSNNDIEVDVQLFGGKGNDVGSFSGGEGGWSYLRLNMKANTEYVIAGLNDYVNTPFLFKKGQLLATVGGGGDANTLGPGAAGGGVSISGANSDRAIGGSSPLSLGENGIHGSASNLSPSAPDTKAAIPNGGVTIRCSKGNLFQFGGQPSPCEDRGSEIEFGLSDGTLVANTKKINRGFKAGYNIFNTAGRNNGAIINQGWGGSGATGGQGSDSYGGAGGSGYIVPSDIDAINRGTADIFVRSEGNAERVASLVTRSGEQGRGDDPISSTLGGSTGPAKVIISLAEIPSSSLAEFIEIPQAPEVIVSEEDVERESEFIPLPEIAPPPPVEPTNPSLSIVRAVVNGFSAHPSGINYTQSQLEQGSSAAPIEVLEKGSITFHVETNEIPAGTTFYWKVHRVGTAHDSPSNPYSDDDFESMTGEIVTEQIGGVVGKSFTVNPKEDSQTDWLGTDEVPHHDWRISIYSDSEYRFRVNNETSRRKYRILDTSLTAPTGRITNLDPNEGLANNIVNNEVNEGNSIRIFVETLDIHNQQLIGWEIIHLGTQPADFKDSIVSGTATVTSGYNLNDDGVPQLRTSDKNKGTANFNIEIAEDFTTEGAQNFALKIKYPHDSNNVIVNTETGLGGSIQHIKIVDTSQDPEANIFGAGTIDEGVEETYTLLTENFITDEEIFWKIIDSGNAIATDFESNEGTALVTETGTNTAGNRTGTASITIKAKADETSEGPETFTLQLYRDSDYTTVVNTTAITPTHSTKSITVNDTSIGTVVYGSTISGINENRECNEGETLTILPKAWNLSTLDEPGDRFYYAIHYAGSDTRAVAGTFSRGRNTNPDFNRNQVRRRLNAIRFKLAGYSKTVGDSSDLNPTLDTTNGYIIPYHEHHPDDIANLRFTAINDFFTDGDKDFEVRGYRDTADVDNIQNEIFTTASFTVKDTSKTKVAFNNVYGFGLPESSPYGNFGQDSTAAPEINEGERYFFRVETSAPPGENLYYRVIRVSDGLNLSDDFRYVDPYDLRPNETFPVDVTFFPENSTRGRVETFDDEGNSTAQRIDGVRCVRSIAYIFLETVADLTSEGDEQFKLVVYNDSGFRNEEVSSTITLKDTSKLNAPTITAEISGSGISSKGSGRYEVTMSRDKDLEISWTVNGEVENGNVRTQPPDDYFSSDPFISNNSLKESDSVSGTLLKLDESDNPSEESIDLTWTLEVENAEGSSTATVTLTLIPPETVPPEVITVKYRKYRSVNVWRWKRKGGDGNQRFCHSTYGPTFGYGNDMNLDTVPSVYFQIIPEGTDLPPYPEIPGTDPVERYVDGDRVPWQSSDNPDEWKRVWGLRMERISPSNADNINDGWKLQGPVGHAFTQPAPGSVNIKTRLAQLGNDVRPENLDRPIFRESDYEDHGYRMPGKIPDTNSNSEFIGIFGYFNDGETDRQSPSSSNDYWRENNPQAVAIAAGGGMGNGYHIIESYWNLENNDPGGYLGLCNLDSDGKPIGVKNKLWRLKYKDGYETIIVDGEEQVVPVDQDTLYTMYGPKPGYHYWREDPENSDNLEYVGQTEPEGSATEEVEIVDYTLIVPFDPEEVP